MIEWLVDTLVMTGALMVLVLLARRPVGRWFGPAAAYALWALPMIRLFLPPLVLPVSLAPTATADIEPLVLSAMPQTDLAERTVAAAPTVATFDPVADIPWVSLLIAIWLGGAVLFLVKRTRDYRTMRRELLEGACEVGHSGKIRIVEAPLVEAPVAFGVFDKVVALPAGFLATADSDASDFAIAHELEHHAGNDLVANIAVQPLFALHWFNPIAWMAWRAMRSDQEAACDARVLSGRSRKDRERYGRLIASFAAGPNLALAAPMAGPLSGDKPIIHRLKALLRNDVPERRKGLGRSLFAAAVIAVPTTASVTYAAVEAPEAPQPPVAPEKHVAPAAPGKEVPRVVIRHADSEARTQSSTGEAPVYKRTVRKGDKVVEFESDRPFDDAEFEREMARVEAEVERAGRAAERAGAEAERKVRIVMRRMNEIPPVPPTPPAPHAPGSVAAPPAPPAPPQSFNVDVSVPRMVRVSIKCGDTPRAISLPEENAREVRAEIERACDKKKIRETALQALREARVEVASEVDLPAEQRANALRAIDEQIARMSKG